MSVSILDMPSENSYFSHNSFDIADFVSDISKCTFYSITMDKLLFNSIYIALFMQLSTYMCIHSYIYVYLHISHVVVYICFVSLSGLYDIMLRLKSEV